MFVSTDDEKFKSLASSVATTIFIAGDDLHPQIGSWKCCQEFSRPLQLSHREIQVFVELNAPSGAKPECGGDGKST